MFVVDRIVDGRGSLGERAVSAAYPTMDIVLLAGLAGFFVTAAWRTPAFLLLVASVVPLLVADEIYGAQHERVHGGDWVDAGWLLSYMLWAPPRCIRRCERLSQPRPRAGSYGSARCASRSSLAALLARPSSCSCRTAATRRSTCPAVVIAATVDLAVFVVLRFVGILRALERIRARLIEADRVKDEFVALISHDFRTPLTSVMGYIELALDDELEPPLDAERRGYLEVVVAQLAPAAAPRRRPALRRAAAGGPTRPDAHGARPVRRSHGRRSDEARAPGRGEGRRARLRGGRRRCGSTATKGRLFQLLDNLVSNAIKFTPEGGRDRGPRLAATGSPVLEVCDTGIGFSDEEAARVFERFFRTERCGQGQVPGTGLGLFIAQAITEAHGGTISASPAHGGGAVFRIELPRAGTAMIGR